MMQIRITNDSPVDVALVRVYDTPQPDGNILPREDRNARRLLVPGESVVVAVGPGRFAMVDDTSVKAAP